jgi:DNA repair exonuclease SbcCD ATPase subunit
MITEVRITNFQSIKEATVKLAPLTIFVGDNRSGKTAIQRAIQAACFNWVGTSFIHHGTKTCSVTLVLDNGDNRHVEVTWTKQRSGSAEYLIDVDGEQRRFTKLGAAVPEEVTDELGFARIEVDKTLTLTPQFHTQMLDPFLIDRSPGQAARALAKLTRLDVVVQAQGLIRTDLRSTKQDHNASSRLIESLEQEEAAFKDIEEEAKQVALLSERVDVLPTCMEDIATARELLNQYRTSKADAALDIPSLDHVRELYAALVSHHACYDQYDRAERRLTKLPDNLPDTVPLALKLRRLQEMRTLFGTFQRSQRIIADIEAEIEEFEADAANDIEAWNAIGTCPTCGQELPKVAA